MRDFVDPRYAKLDFLAKRRVTVATSVTDRHCMAGALPGWKSHRFRLDPHSSWQRKIVGTALSLPLRSKAAKRCTAACAGLIVRPSLASSNFAHECASVQSRPQRAPIELSNGCCREHAQLLQPSRVGERLCLRTQTCDRRRRRNLLVRAVYDEPAIRLRFRSAGSTKSKSRRV